MNRRDGYLHYKKLEKETFDSGNLHAIGILTEQLMPMIDNQIRSYKYTHCDLTPEDHVELMRMNGLNDDDALVGGAIYRVVGDIKLKKDFITKVDEIDLFMILRQINYIVTKRQIIYEHSLR